MKKLLDKGAKKCISMTRWQIKNVTQAKTHLFDS